MNKQLRFCDAIKAVTAVLTAREQSPAGQALLGCSPSLPRADLGTLGHCRSVLTENASFSKKWEIPLRYFASCLDPEFTRTDAKKRINQRDSYTPGPHNHIPGSEESRGDTEPPSPADTHCPRCRTARICSARRRGARSPAPSPSSRSAPGSRPPRTRLWARRAAGTSATRWGKRRCRCSSGRPPART